MLNQFDVAKKMEENKRAIIRGVRFLDINFLQKICSPTENPFQPHHNFLPGMYWLCVKVFLKKLFSSCALDFKFQKWALGSFTSYLLFRTQFLHTACRFPSTLIQCGFNGGLLYHHLSRLSSLRRYIYLL